MSERVARLVLAAVAVALVVSAALTDLPRLSGRQFWSDGATYHAMAWSLAEEFDLRYEAHDLLRVRREYPSGPQGIFLKRASGGLTIDREAGFPWLRRVPKDAPRIYYAKPFLYPAVAAPLVRLLGTRGLLVTNALSLSVAMILGYSRLRRQSSPGRALALTLVLFLATVAPVYLLWLHPELFGLALVTGALVAWSRQRPVLAALLFGVATYLKPTNLFLALPLGLEPMLRRPGQGLGGGLLESARRGAVLAVVVAVLFGMNAAITGEVNYQGGERKTFLGRFPFESHEVTFGNSGQWMTTDHLGPLVEGQDEALQSRRTGPLRAPGEIRESFFRNLAYFWIGRFGGALPYFFPAVLAAAGFLLLGPRERAGWLALASLLVSYVFYIWMIPDNWYGGGGTVGNRYFLNLLPLALFLVPRRREWVVAAAGLVAGAIFIGPVLLSPVRHSLRPGDHATRAVFRMFPPELTMLNDLSVFTEPWRKKRPVGDTEGDAHKHWPADPKAYYLYFLDNGAFGLEGPQGEEGFWLRAGEPCEVVLRALEPVRRMRIRLTGGPAGDEVRIRLAGREERMSLPAGETREAVLEPGPAFAYYDTFLHLLRFASRGGEAVAVDGGGRRLGAFVRIALEVDKRPRDRR